MLKFLSKLRSTFVKRFHQRNLNRLRLVGSVFMVGLYREYQNEQHGRKIPQNMPSGFKLIMKHLLVLKITIQNILYSSRFINEDTKRELSKKFMISLYRVQFL